MAEDPYPQLRAELEAALVIVEEESRGLKDFAATSISQPLRDQTVTPIAERDERATLIHNALREMDLVIDAMMALEADGYPTPVPKSPLGSGLYEEAQGQAADLKAGMLVFTPEGTQSSGFTLTMTPVPA